MISDPAVGVSSVTCTVGGRPPRSRHCTVVSPAITAVLPAGVQTGNFIVAGTVGASAGFRYAVGA